MDVQITKKNGDSYTLEKYGIIVKDFIVSSIPLESVYGNVEGRDGNLDYGARYASRTITIPFEMKAHDLMDYPLLRDKLFNFVSSKESFYIREMRRSKKLAYAFVDTNEPSKMNAETDNKLVGGKRYMVRLQNAFDLEQVELYGAGELILETTELPFAESIGTTADLNNGITYDSELWGYGMGLTDDDHKYSFNNATQFNVFNAGDVPIHPFEQELKITITGVAGEGFTLTNQRTGDTFKVNDTLSPTDVIVIDGPNITINGLQALRRTNRKFITFEIGNNILTSNLPATLSVDMRFYYV